MATITLLADALAARYEAKTGQMGNKRVRAIVKALRSGDKKTAQAILRSPMTDQNAITRAIAYML